MTNTIETQVETERPQVELREDSRRGWLRIYDAGKRRLTSRTGREIEHREAEAPVAEAGGKPPWKLISFLVMVFVPFLVSVLYFGFIASDQYTAEARFAVRSLADDGAGENLDGGILNMKAASQDAYVVTSFIRSPEIFKRLEGKVDYRAMFERPEADFWARFDPDDSNEDFLKYWMNHVTAYIDGPSGIVTLSVQTFRPEDSVRLASALLEESEKLVNELTVRAREDMLASFQLEIERTAELYQTALAKLNRFQQRTGLLSPADQAQQSGTLLAGLLAQKLEIESRLFVIQQSGGTDSPAYRQRLLAREALDQQIENMRAQLTGEADASLANVITEFTAVETDRLVAEKLYEAARRNYDQAFAASLRKALYLTVFVNPTLPEEALYPRRLISPLLIFLGLLVFWSTLALAWASVEDHRL